MAVSGEFRPVMRVSAETELVSAYLTPDSVSGASLASQATIGLYRFDASGSVAAATLLASIDGAAASATAWAAMRAKPMIVSSAKITLHVGDVLALSNRANWTGSLSMRFRRAL